MTSTIAVLGIGDRVVALVKCMLFSADFRLVCNRNFAKHGLAPTSCLAFLQAICSNFSAVSTKVCHKPSWLEGMS